jgi:hypothetical protein
MSKTTIAIIASLAILSGCSEPRVPAPKGLRVPEGTLITIAQYQSELEAAKNEAETKQRMEETKAQREIKKIERSTKNAADAAIAEAQDKVDEINESIKASAFDRQASLDMLTESMKQAKLDIEERQAFTLKAFDAVNQIAGSGIIPGGQLALPILGIVGALFGLKKSKEVKAARKDHESHVDAIDHAADVLPELRDALEKAKPIIAEWQTATSQKATNSFRSGGMT